jgi:rhodanese-related sulfurtransferase
MINEIEVKDLKLKMDNGEKLLLVDCRENEEWEVSHIIGAKLIPLSELQILFEKELPNKDENIILQCRSGQRSMNAAMFLLSKGYKNLTNLEGGILAWIDAGYSVK